MRASRSVGRRVAQGLRDLATKAGKGEASKPVAGKPAAKPAPAAPAPPAAPAAKEPAPPAAAAPAAPTAAAAAAASSTAAPAAAPAASAARPVNFANPPPKAPVSASAAAKPVQPAPGASGGAGGSSGGGAGSGQAAGAAAAGGGGEGGKWIIHPAVPLDARLVGVGLLGGGLLSYALTPKREVEDAAAALAAASGRSEAAADELQQAEGQQAGAAEQEGATLEDTAPTHVDEGFQAAPAGGEGAGAGQPPAGGPAEEVAVVEAEEEEQGPPTYVDGSKVLGLIEEVFSSDAARLLRAAEALAEAAPPPSQEPAPAEPAVPEVKSADSSRARRRQQRGGLGVREEQERLDAVQAGLADTSADLLVSELGKAAPAAKPAKAPEPAAEPEAPLLPLPVLAELGPEVAQASRSLAGVDPLVKDILGLQQDVTPAGLIQAAIKHGLGPGEDWVQYRHRHRQAVADAQFVAALLEAAAKNVKGKLEAKDAELDKERATVAAVREGLRLQGEEFRKLLATALEDADRQAQTALKLQAQTMAVAHAENTVRERKERQAKVDEVRVKLDALQEAFHRRSVERRAAHSAHQIATGAFALQSALKGGQPLREALAYLGRACKDDPLVTTALAAVPPAAAEAGTWTRTQIADAFEDVQRVSRQLSWVPEGQGGLITLALAKLASKLKITERGPVAASVAGPGIDGDLARVQCELLSGRLLQAAEDLEAAVKGTAAAREVSAWVQQVRTRVLAEQTAALLQAHASALSASLA